MIEWCRCALISCGGDRDASARVRNFSRRPIRVAAVGYSDDAHVVLFVVDGVDRSILAAAGAPEIVQPES